MKQFITFLFSVAFVGTSLAQEIIETKYFKKWYTGATEVSETKAVFKQTKTKYPDGRIEIKQTRIKDNFVIWSKTYLDNEPVGVWFQYYDNGKLMSRLDYDQNLNYSEEQPNDAPYVDLYSKSVKSKIDGNFEFASLNEYPEGFTSYLVKNMRYPGPAFEKKITGLVVVLISIDEQGKTKVLSILKSEHKYLALEAYRLLNELPTWSPFKLNGSTIKVYAIVPIKFNLG